VCTNQLCSSHAEQLWVWNYEGDRLYYDPGEMLRFQVVDEEWHDQTPLGPNQTADTAAKIPYKIKGNIAGEGLGPCFWWDTQEQE
jgi:DNA-directed RNA polymerase III subunit RPC8